MEVGIADSNRPYCVPASPNYNKKQPGPDDKVGMSVISCRYGEVKMRGNKRTEGTDRGNYLMSSTGQDSS